MRRGRERGWAGQQRLRERVGWAAEAEREGEQSRPGR
jgi:hypothetical protein